MKRKAITLADRALQYGISPPLLSQWFSGYRKITWSRAKYISKIVNVPPALLMDATPSQLRRILGNDAKA